MGDYITLMFDNGSYEFKAGRCGEEQPDLVFPTVLKTRRDGEKQYYVGNDAIANSNSYHDLIKPIKKGIPQDWDQLHALYSHTLDKLDKLVAAPAGVIVSESQKDDTIREKMTQLLFESFNFECMYIANSTLLGMYAHGCTSGLAVDVGYESTQILPIYEGYINPETAITLDIGCDHVSKYLNTAIKSHTTTNYSNIQCDSQANTDVIFNNVDLGQNNCYNLLASKMRTISYSPFTIDAVKASICYVAPTGPVHEEPNTANYTLPDGSTVTLQRDRFMSTEVLFDPSLIGSSVQGIHTAAISVAKDIDPLQVADMYQHVIFVGGGAMFNGFTDRLFREISQQVKYEVKMPKYTDSRKYANWIGGSILGSLSTFGGIWIKKREYEEYGTSVVRRRIL
jgi:actin-related protein